MVEKIPVEPAEDIIPLNTFTPTSLNLEKVEGWVDSEDIPTTKDSTILHCAENYRYFHGAPVSRFWRDGGTCCADVIVGHEGNEDNEDNKQWAVICSIMTNPRSKEAGQETELVLALKEIFGSQYILGMSTLYTPAGRRLAEWLGENGVLELVDLDVKNSHIIYPTRSNNRE